MSIGITVLKSTAYAVAAAMGTYLAFLVILTVPLVQDQVIYLNKVTLTWGMDVNYPEQWGFLHNQVTPYKLQTSDGESLHAWHIIPPGLYQKHEKELVAQPAGLATDIEARLGFQLLRDDPDALLVLYFHGAAGTLGSGFRPPSYRAISALDPDKVHIVAIDYRGFGTSSGSPSEAGLLADAIAVAEFAMVKAKIPADRIVLFAQSLGTAVATSLAHHHAMKPDPVFFSGMVFVAPFVNVELLTATYKVAGTIPLLDPVARFPRLLAFLNGFIRDKWQTKYRLAEIVTRVQAHESEDARFWINLIHAEDDYDIPWTHTEKLFKHTVDAMLPTSTEREGHERDKSLTKTDLGAGGWSIECQSDKGFIREDIIKYGLHDRTMSYPIVGKSIRDAFRHHRVYR